MRPACYSFETTAWCVHGGDGRRETLADMYCNGAACDDSRDGGNTISCAGLGARCAIVVSSLPTETFV